MPVDVIPYGRGVDDITRIRVDRDRTLDATGMHEAASCCLTVRVEVDGKDDADLVRVPDVHAQIALKLIAFGLRIHIPDPKDAGDLTLLLCATWEGARAREDFYEHSHLVPDLDYEIERVGPYLAGARIRRDFGDAIATRLIAVTEIPALVAHMRRDDARTLAHPDSGEMLRDLVAGLSDVDLAVGGTLGRTAPS